MSVKTLHNYYILHIINSSAKDVDIQFLNDIIYLSTSCNTLCKQRPFIFVFPAFRLERGHHRVSYYFFTESRNLSESNKARAKSNNLNLL